MEKKYHIKHIELYIIAFFIFLGVAVFSFVYGCSNLARKEPGVYEIVPNANEDAPTYGANYSFYYYFDGSGTEINNKIKEVTDFYSEKLSLVYKQLDEENIYSSVSSIAAVNNNPNQPIQLGQKARDVLFDAYSRSQSADNYSLFAEPIYNFWYQSFSFADETIKISRDPVNNAQSKEYLDKLTSYINDKNHIDLEFLEDNKVILHVSDEYLSFAEDNGDSFLYVGLNVLKNAYILDDVTSYFESLGLNNGFVLAKNGTVVKMSGFKTKEYYPIYSFTDKVVAIGQLDMDGPNNINNMRRFSTDASLYNSGYHFSKDGVTYFRSSVIDIHSGIPSDYCYASSIAQNNLSVIESTVINNELALFTDMSEISAYLKSLNNSSLMALVIPRLEEKKIYVNESMYKFVSLLGGLDYNLIKF